MSKEGYVLEKKEGDNKIVLERLQTYLKDKRSSESSETSVSYGKPGPNYELHQQPSPTYEDGSNALKEILNHKKAELLRHPDVTDFLKTVSANLKK